MTVLAKFDCVALVIVLSAHTTSARNSFKLNDESSFHRKLISTAPSTCPSNPSDYCDFFFEGYEDSLPVISLDGPPDTGVGPYIVDSKTDSIVQVGNSGDGTLLCSSTTGQSAGNQFYVAGQEAQIRFRTFNQDKTQFENQCIHLPLLAVQIYSANLNPGDDNQSLYPDERRCVMFATGPSGASCLANASAPSPAEAPSDTPSPAEAPSDAPSPVESPSLTPSPVVIPPAFESPPVSGTPPVAAPTPPPAVELTPPTTNPLSPPAPVVTPAAAPTPSTAESPPVDTAPPPNVASPPMNSPSPPVSVAPEPSTGVPSPASTPSSSSSPLFPAIFTFGDSTADVGTNNYLPLAGFSADRLPYGEDFIPASGRFSNGKLVGDFVAEAVGLTSAPPFLQPNASFANGANFASGGSGVLDSTVCGNSTFCISLSAQVAQFTSIYSGYTAEVLAQSLFFISAGSNDYFAYIGNETLQAEVNTTAFITEVVTGLVEQIQVLYFLGARKFIVFDAAPIGCVPFALAFFNVSETDPQCVTALNLFSLGHSVAIAAAIAEVQLALPDAVFTVGKTYNAVTGVVSNLTAFGLSDTLDACCGGGLFNALLPCNVNATLCPDPYVYFFWDSIHPTEFFYNFFATKVLAGDNDLVQPYGIYSLASLPA